MIEPSGIRSTASASTASPVLDPQPGPAGRSRRKLWAAAGSATAVAAVLAGALFSPGTASAAGTQVAGQAAAPLTTITLPALRAGALPAATVAGLGRQPATRLCGKLERVAAQAHRAQTRLEGAATVKGSVNALKARVDAQTKKGHTQAAKKLSTKLANRTAGLAKLKTTETGLAALIAADCGK